MALNQSVTGVDEMGRMKRKLTYIVKAVFSVAFFAVIFSFAEGTDLLVMLDKIDWLYFVLSFLLVPVMLSTSCMKWKIILDESGKRVPFFSLIRIYLVGYFFSNLLPSTVGGDVVRSFYAGKLINNQPYSAVSVFVERFSGILFLLILVIIAPFLQPQLYLSPYFYIPTCCAIVLFGVIIWVWIVNKPLELPHRVMTSFLYTLEKLADRSGIKTFGSAVKFIFRLYSGLINRLERFHYELTNAVRAIRDDKILFLKIIVLTVFFYFLTWVNVYVTFRAFEVNPGFLVVCALVPTIMFVGHLPVTLLGNLGFFESVFVFYFLQVGVFPAESLAMGLLLRLKMLSLGLIGYLVYIMYKNRRPEELEQLEAFADKKQSVVHAADEAS